MVPIIVLIIIIALFAGSVSATNNTKWSIYPKSCTKKISLIRVQTNFTGVERGGLFAYTWKTYKTSNGVVGSGSL